MMKKNIKLNIRCLHQICNWIKIGDRNFNLFNLFIIIFLGFILFISDFNDLFLNDYENSYNLINYIDISI